jgi:hypothetical protein
MYQVAGVALILSGVLSAGAIVSFPWSVSTSRLLLPAALACAAFAVLTAGLTGVVSALAAWTAFFAFGASGCDATAIRNLFSRPTRWVHRFVIYSGYGTTFAWMGAGSVWLGAKAVPGRLTAGVLVGVFVAGSGCIFLAKLLTLRLTASSMAEYHASLTFQARGQDGDHYW